MQLLKKTDTEKPFTIKYHLKYALKVAAIFGFGEFSSWRSLPAKIVYCLYSIISISFMLLMLVRLLFAFEWSTEFNLTKAAIVLSMTYIVQSLVSFIFSVYATRRGHFNLLKRSWTECQGDELVSQTDFGRTQWCWFVPVIIFAVSILAMEIVALFLQYHGLTLESSSNSTKPFLNFWSFFILIPAITYCVLAYDVTFYIFFTFFLSLSYAWRGFAEKIKRLTENKSASGFSEETLQFVSDTHMQLTELTETVNLVYGPYALIMIILAVPDMFLQLYFAAHMPNDGLLRAQTVTTLLISFISVFLLFSACMVNTAASQVADIFYRYYYLELKKKSGANNEVSEKVLLQTSILLTKLYNSSSIGISACGWFEVSKATLGGIFSILATGYFIFLMGPEVAPGHAVANMTLKN